MQTRWRNIFEKKKKKKNISFFPLKSNATDTEGLVHDQLVQLI